MQSKRVVVVGVGMVGSQIAEALANCAIGHLVLIDHDAFEVENAFRHALPVEYLGQNKATSLADYLSKQIEGNIQVEPVIHKVDNARLLDRWLSNADLIVAATDDRKAQRRVGQEALKLGIPAIFPALYLEDGGEIIVQIDAEVPCFGCWDYFRTNEEQLRGVVGLPIAAQPVVYTTVRLCLGFLDPASADRDLMRNGPNRPPLQFFALDRSGTLDRGVLTRRQDCPSCGGRARQDAAGPIWTEAGSPPLTPNNQPPPRGFSTAGRRQRDVNRVLLTVCAAIIAALLIAIVSTDSKPPAEISTPVSVKMDYSQSLPRMIQAAHLRTVENNVPITETQFPVGWSGPPHVKVALIRLTHAGDLQADGVHHPAHYQAAYNDVLDKLSQLGYRPATLPELLAFVVQDPEMQSLSMVELAGPVYLERDVTCEVSQGYLQCSSVADGFDQAAEFIAVKQ